MRAKIQSRRGRPTIDSEEVRSRMPREILDGMDAAANDESDKPARAEMLRRIVKDWLIGHGYLKASEESDGNGR